MKKNKSNKLLPIAVSITVVLSVVYVYIWQTEINEAYVLPYSVAKGAQRGLSAGISPDGVIGDITEKTGILADIWKLEMPKSEHDDFIYIKETAKTYETSSNNVKISDLNIFDKFIQKTQEAGEAQTRLKIRIGIDMLFSRFQIVMVM